MSAPSNLPPTQPGPDRVALVAMAAVALMGALTLVWATSLSAG